MNELSSKRTLWNPPPTLFHVTDSPWSTVTAAGMNTSELVAVTVWLAARAGATATKSVARMPIQRQLRLTRRAYRLPGHRALSKRWGAAQDGCPASTSVPNGPHPEEPLPRAVAKTNA